MAITVAAVAIVAVMAVMAVVAVVAVMAVVAVVATVAKGDLTGPNYRLFYLLRPLHYNHCSYWSHSSYYNYSGLSREFYSKKNNRLT